MVIYWATLYATSWDKRHPAPLFRFGDFGAVYKCLGLGITGANTFHFTADACCLCGSEASCLTR